MNPNTDDSEPGPDTLQSAMLATVRLWLGAVLLNPNACDCVVDTLLDDEQAAVELGAASDWLLASASHLPPAMSTVRVLQLLSVSSSLDEMH